MNAAITRFPKAPEPTPANTARLAFLAAKSAGVEHMDELLAALAEVARLAGEAADMAAVLPPGVPDECKRLAEDIRPRALRLTAMMERAP